MVSRFININEKEIEISQDTAFGYAGEVWDAALVLSHFMINENKLHNFTFENKTILELGSGTGMCGLTAFALGAKEVYLTDKKENLEILNKNYNLNSNTFNSTGNKLNVVSLDWANKEDYNNIKVKPEIILGSDIIWNPAYFQSLIDTLDHFLEKNVNQAILCYQYRQKSDLDFFEMIKSKNWTIERIGDKYLDEEYQAPDIFIVVIKK